MYTLNICRDIPHMWHNSDLCTHTNARGHTHTHTHTHRLLLLSQIYCVSSRLTLTKPAFGGVIVRFIRKIACLLLLVYCGLSTLGRDPMFIILGERPVLESLSHLLQLLGDKAKGSHFPFFCLCESSIQVVPVNL